jgi:predicted flavoprotein YhiN
VFNVSSFVAGKENATLKIEFVPEKSQEELKEIIKSRLNKPEIFGENLLVGIVNKRIGQAILKSASKVDAECIASAIKNFTLKVTGNLGFNYSQVTHGGIITKDIDEKTYESKINKGLFVVGEVLDVDGDCGGYNLAFAFVSGIKSAREIKSRG